MKAHITLDLSDPMAASLLGYLETLPFATVEREKKSFEEAARECNAISADEFFDQLDERIKRRFHA